MTSSKAVIKSQMYFLNQEAKLLRYTIEFIPNLNTSIIFLDHKLSRIFLQIPVLLQNCKPIKNIPTSIFYQNLGYESLTCNRRQLCLNRLYISPRQINRRALVKPEKDCQTQCITLCSGWIDTSVVTIQKSNKSL